MQVRCFLAASERAEREALATQVALLVTATHGGKAEITALLHELNV